MLKSMYRLSNVYEYCVQGQQIIVILAKHQLLVSKFPTATEESINGNPILKKRLNVIKYPFFSANPAATTPALEPISVPLPPRFAPSDSAHQRGLN